jgi:hypothetical protein
MPGGNRMSAFVQHRSTYVIGFQQREMPFIQMDLVIDPAVFSAKLCVDADSVCLPVFPCYETSLVMTFAEFPHKPLAEGPEVSHQ